MKLQALLVPFIAIHIGAAPLSLADCGKIPKAPGAATAVYSLSIWNKDGWPLWRNTCYWSAKGKP